MTKREFRALFAHDKRLWHLDRLREAIIQSLISMGCDPPGLIVTTPKNKQDIMNDLSYCQTQKIQTFTEFERSLWGGIASSLSNRLLLIQRREAWANRDPSKKSQCRPLEELKQYPITSICDSHNIQHIKAGTNRERVCCPFHNEKTPSLIIFTDKNRYHCFGCQAHGSNIDFLAAVDNITFSEALKIINSLMG